MNDNTDLPHQSDTLQHQLPHAFKPRKLLALFAAVILLAVVAGTGSYLAVRTTNQAPATTKLNNPEAKPIRGATGAELERKHTYYNNKGHWGVIYPGTLLPPSPSTDGSVVYFRGQRSIGQDPEVLYWFISIQSWELIILGHTQKRLQGSPGH